MGSRLLERGSSLQPRRRVRELHERRRSPRPPAGDLRRALLQARSHQAEVRPDQPVPGHPKHSAGGRQGIRMNAVSTLAFVLLTLLAGPPLAAVDDPYSFGRPMKWRGGFLGIERVMLRADCTVVPEGVRCVPLLPAPASTSFEV